MRYLTNIDLNKNQLQNAVIQPVAILPEAANGTTGQIIFYAPPKKDTLGNIVYNADGTVMIDANLAALYQHNGTTWERVGSVYVQENVDGKVITGLTYNGKVLTTSLKDIKINDTETLEQKLNNLQSKANLTETITTILVTDTDDIDDIISNTSGKAEDILIIKKLIVNNADESKRKYSYTSYVYNGETKVWEAMDGNYDASNVYLKNDIKLAGDYTSVGNVDKETIAATKDAGWAGKSLEDILTNIFTQVLYPTKPTPKLTWELVNSGAKEIGSTVTPRFKVTFDPKTYEYGTNIDPTPNSSTWCEPIGDEYVTTETEPDYTPWTISPAVNGGKSTTEFNAPEIIITADTDYYGIEILCSISDSAIPLTNTGKSDDTKQIKATEGISCDTHTKKITGYREGFFYGTSANTLNINDLTSDFIRQLNKTGTAYVSGAKSFIDTNGDGRKDTTLVVPSGTKHIIFACPTNKTGIIKVENTTVNANMTNSFVTRNMIVAGADGDPQSEYAEEYTIYMYTPVEAYSIEANILVTLG